ncbi:uncharacterized protein LOC129268056 [Lytechinus pictus]|uniref:uncharacterized protein LOC129268056 n=1 Tax=Lytechinus pictus TaxID=7653 RepID=UPI0030BA1DB6
MMQTEAMKSVLFWTTLIIVISAACAINCYNCEGDECRDPFDPEGISTTCPGSSFLPNNFCRKTVTATGTTVVRSCGTNERNECTPGCTESETCTYCCEYNLCNRAITMTINFVAMGVASVTALLLTRQ